MSDDTLSPELLDTLGLDDLAQLWRRARASSGGHGAEPRVVLVGQDPALVRRARAHLQERVPRAHLELHPLPGPPDGPPSRSLVQAVAAADHLVWVTPVVAPLGESERACLGAWADTPPAEALPRPPGTSWVYLGDRPLLARLTDDPAGEAAAILQRVVRLLPEGWAVLPEEGVVGQLARGAGPGRDRALGTWLAAHGHHRLARRLDALAREEASVATARRDREEAHRARTVATVRAVRRWLAVARRETEDLTVALRTFLAEVSEALPSEIVAVPSRDAAARALPDWLQRVVEDWLDARLAETNARILRSLDDADLDPEVLARAALVLPGVAPDVARPTVDWRARVGATSAVGTGAAMLWLGLWAPGALALSGGLAWTRALGRAAREPDLDALVARAREALRRVGEQAEAGLRDQLGRLETVLQTLTEAPGADGASQEAAHASEQAQLASIRGERERLAARRDRLVACLAPDPTSAGPLPTPPRRPGRRRSAKDEGEPAPTGATPSPSVTPESEASGG